jgi:hypothetical protein
VLDESAKEVQGAQETVGCIRLGCDRARSHANTQDTRARGNRWARNLLSVNDHGLSNISHVDIHLNAGIDCAAHKATPYRPCEAAPGRLRGRLTRDDGDQ